MTTAPLFALALSLAAPATGPQNPVEPPVPAEPEEPAATGGVRIGVKAQIGGRFDDVRMCVATPAGVKGGMAADISFFVELPVTDNLRLLFNLPVMRPILFAAAFGMLQFEPDLIFLVRRSSDWGIDLVTGPSLGVSLHYGADYTFGPEDDVSGSEFFAWGPRLGAYFGIDFSRLIGLDLQIGLAPTVSPLFAIDDPANHQGIVVGVMLDGQLGLLGG